MSEEIAQKLSTLVTKRLHKLFKVPRGFPNVQFDWVTEDDLRHFTRIEASAPGTWELPHGREVSNVILKAEVDKHDPKNASWASLEAEFGLGPHTIHAVARFPGEFKFETHLTNSSLEHFLAAMAPESTLLETIPAFWFREADLVFNPATVAFDFQGEVESDWILPIGPEGLSLSAIGISLSRSAGRPIATPLDGEIRGAIFISDNAIPVAHELGDPLAFSGECEKLDLAELLHQLCDSSVSRRVPFIYQQMLGHSVFTASLENNTVFVETEPTGNFGASQLVIENREGLWGYSIAPELPDDWKLSRLAPFLWDLNELSVANPMLAISAFEQPPVELFPEWPDDLDDRLRAGVNLVMPVSLRGLPQLELLASACRLKGRLRMAGSLSDGDSGRELLLEAPLERFELAEGVQIADPILKIRQLALRSFDVTVTGNVRVRVVGEEWRSFVGAAEVGPDAITLKANLAETWESPYGLRISKIDVLNLRVTLREGAEKPEIQLVGRGSIRKTQGSVRILWSETGGPHPLRLAFDSIPAAVAVQELGPAGQSAEGATRLALEPGFDHVLMTATPDTRELEGEFNLLGKGGRFLAIFGAERAFCAYGSIEAFREQRVAGGRHVFELTRGELGVFAKIDDATPESFPADADGPLVRVAFGDAPRPGIQLAGEATLFTEFTQPVLAEITKKGATFPYRFDDRRVSLNLDCRIDKEGFYAQGEATSRLDFQVDITEPKSGVRFASLRLEAPMRSKLSLTVGATFEAVISGGIVWRDHELSAPKFVLTETPTTFSDLETAMENALRERLYTMVLKSELGSPAAFFSAARDGWLQTGRSLGLTAVELSQALKNALGAAPDDLAGALREFGYSWAEIVEALSTTSRLGVEPVAKPLQRAGASAAQIAFALRAVHEAPHDGCAMALRGAGFDPVEIAKALKLSCEAGPEDLTRVLRLVGRKAKEVAAALHKVSPTPATTAFRVFRAAGFKAPETVAALRGIYDTSRDYTRQLLADAGYSDREIRSAIDREFEELGGIFG